MRRLLATAAAVATMTTLAACATRGPNGQRLSAVIHPKRVEVERGKWTVVFKADSHRQGCGVAGEDGSALVRIGDGDPVLVKPGSAARCVDGQTIHTEIVMATAVTPHAVLEVASQ